MTNLFNRPPFTMMPEAIKQMIINQIPVTTFEGNPSQTRYKPEYSYNYEIGGHFSLFNNKIQLDMAAFYMDIYDQQISKFAGSGLGRIMVNAGRGQSAGAELSLRGSLIDKKLDWFATYGYTHATFKRYEAQTATEEQTGINYNGNFVPFVPQHIPLFRPGCSAASFFPNRSWQSVPRAAPERCRTKSSRTKAVRQTTW